MTITEDRMSRYRKRKAQQRKIVGTTFGTVLIASVLVIAVFIFSIVRLYIGTRTWNNSMKHMKLSEIAPEYVSDYPSLEKQQYIEMSEAVTKTLNKTAQDMKLPADAKLISEKSDAFIKKNNIKSGTLVDATKRLHLYQTYFEYVNNYTTKLDTKTLRGLIGDLNREVLERDRDVDKQMLARLNEIVTEYEALRTVMTAVLPNYGKTDGDTMTVLNNIDDLSEFKKELETVKQFPQIAELLKLVNENGSRIVENNKSLAAQEAYKNIKTMLSQLNGLYVKRSDVKTYEDVVKNGWSVEGSYKNDDKVAEIVYNGRRVEDSEWIRIDAKPQIIMEHSWAQPSTPSSTNATERSRNRTSRSTTTESSSSTSTTQESTYETSTDTNSTESSEYPRIRD